MTTISVITATYNSAATVADTMRSVLAQTHPHVEHIIVDGCSTDTTLEVVETFRPRYQASGKSLRVISEPDHGIYDAMNKGIRLATGDVVGLLNSDDFYTSDQILASVAESIEGVDAVYADIHFVDPADLSRPVRYYSSSRFRRWKMLAGYMPAHPSFYCRRRVYQTFGAFDPTYRIAADFDQLFRLIYINRLATRYIDRDFVTMRTGGASTSGLRSHLRIFSEHCRTYLGHSLWWAIPLDLTRYPLRLIDLWRYKLRKG